MSTAADTPAAPTDRARLSDLNALAMHHYGRSDAFKNIVERLFSNRLDAKRLEDLPYLPAEIFKTRDLKSIGDEEVFKVLTSSGTSSQVPSRISLDKDNARAQSKALSAIMGATFGPKRMPMLIIDCPAQIAQRSGFSARGAGILGFSMFASKRFFALHDDMSINVEAVKEFLAIEADKKLVFGFTFIIWQEFLQKVAGLDLPAGVGDVSVLHGGGWKKLSSQNISAADFHAALRSQLPSVGNIHDYYGMVEQTGSIFMGCPAGFLHTNPYNDILVRDPETLAPVEHGTRGVLQVFSTLPRSYPGFSILTEDVGTLHGDSAAGQPCTCGQPGKFFSVHGRLAQAEIRGCSDTYRAAA